MHTTHLRKVGGSIMLAVPPAFLDQLHLQAGATVGLAVEHGCLVGDPRPKPRSTPLMGPDPNANQALMHLAEVSRKSLIYLGILAPAVGIEPTTN